MLDLIKYVGSVLFDSLRIRKQLLWFSNIAKFAS